MKEQIQFHLNGKPIAMTVDTDRPLLWVIRTDLELTGVKHGCGAGYCGACTVLIDDQAVRSCQMIIRDVQDKNVVTVEGLTLKGNLHPVQTAFIEHNALQCGYCTPGMILNAVSLLTQNPTPTRQEIINGMEDNLCRCGSHQRIVQAIQAAAREMNGGKSYEK